MFRIILLWIERVIASCIFKNIDFWSMQKRRFVFFISKTICWMEKFQIRKRCALTRRAITYFLFRIFMHFDFLLIIGKVLYSSSVASPYSIRSLNWWWQSSPPDLNYIKRKIHCADAQRGTNFQYWHKSLALRKCLQPAKFPT